MVVAAKAPPTIANLPRTIAKPRGRRFSGAPYGCRELP